MIKRLYKTLFLISSWTVWTLTFISFQPHGRSRENLSDEVVRSQKTRQRNDQIGRKWTFYRTTTLDITPHYESPYFIEPPYHITLQTKQTMTAAEEAVLTQTLALLPPPPIFKRIPKRFETTVSTFLISSPEPKITYTS